MRYGVIADIHGNLEAFEQVRPLLESVDTVCCLGDIVGYGPNPSECIELFQQIPNTAVVGNHDLGSVGKISLYDFNSDARQACNWTRGQLTDSQNDYLKGLPLQAEIGKDILLVHGSPRDPVWEYLLSPKDAEINFNRHNFRICFVGHTHIPAIFQKPTSGECEIVRPEVNQPRQLNKKMRYVINVGSIGQPRDGDPRASFAIFEEGTNTIEFFRVAYPVGKTQEKMKDKGLSPFLISRLSFGM